MLFPLAGLNICSIVPIYLYIYIYISTKTSEHLSTGIVLCSSVTIHVNTVEAELETFQFLSSTLLLSEGYERPIFTSTCH